MATYDVGNLTIEVDASSAKAASNIEVLTNVLKELRAAASSSGSALHTVKAALDKAGNVKSVSATMKSLSSSIKAVKADYSGLAPEIQKVAQQWTVLPQNVQKAATAMASAKSAMDALSGNKLTVSANEAKAALDSLAAAAGRTAMGMNKKSIDAVAAAYASLPPAIQRAIKAQASLTKVNERTGLSFKSLKGAIAKATVAYLAMRGISNAISGWITESNAYVENLNLFNVAMGEYADEAKRYADEVANVMGIDPSAWMRSQGVFMTLATGFGVAADKAAIMSTQLTQLGYDLSSFFNISVEDSMQKLQSGISGELEPLRRLGYDLSQARLQSIALANGIDKSVSSMSQAEKAQLRYYAIMTQVTEAQGDMARTLHAPANQLRILQAQLTQTSRALGNVFIPMLNAVLPYVIAFVQVLRMAADALANLLGFKLPDIDYSGLDGVSTGASDATDALNAATGAAKELKGQLAGFDEITLITQTETGGGGGGAGVDLGGDLGLPLQQYDFLGDAIEDKVAEITKAIKKFLPLIETVGKALLAAFAGNALLKGLQKLSAAMGWKGLTGILGAAKTALLGFTAGFVPGAILTYTSTIIDAKDGTLGWSSAVTALTAVIGAAMAVIGAMRGSIGVAAAGIGLVVGAITGLSLAHKQLRQDMIDAVFFDEQGIAISALADSYVKWMDAMIAANQPIITTHENIEASKEVIRSTAGEMNYLIWAVQNGAMSVADALPQIQTAFETLESETRSIFDNIYQNITRALAGSVGEAVVAAGGSVEQMLGIITDITGRVNNELDTLMAEYEDVYSQLKSGQGDKIALTDALNELSVQIMQLSQEASPELVGLKNSIDSALSDVNWQSMDEATAALENVGTKAAEAKDSFRVMADSLITDIETLKLNATPEEMNILDGLIESIKTSRDANIAAIDSEIQALMDAVQTNLVTSSKGVIEAASAEWESLDWFTQAFVYGGNKANLVEKTVQQFRTETVDPLLARIGESFGEDTVWAETAMDSMMDNLFKTVSGDYHGNYQPTAKALTDNIQGAISEALPEKMQAVGEDMMNGIATSITDNTQIAADAMRAALTDGNSSVFAAAQEANQSHSPSKLYATEGLNMMEGLADGITGNKNAPISAMRGVLEELKRITDNAMRSLVNSVNATLREISASAANVSATVSSSARVNVKGYASGGFPATGQMFLARESGPELVGTIGNRTAVANNDQIVSSVAEGVASANEEQNALLRQQNELLMALLDKEWSIGGEPNASFGRFASRSIDRYAAMAGRA